MFNVTPLEILTIGLLALVLFGPKRLPEIARRVGKIAREVRQAADDFREGLDREYETLSRPLKEVQEEARKVLDEVSNPPAEEADDEEDRHRSDG